MGRPKKAETPAAKPRSRAVEPAAAKTMTKTKTKPAPAAKKKGGGGKKGC